MRDWGVGGRWDSAVMAKTATRFLCRDCGAVQSRWAGKCPACGAWNTLEEYRDPGKAARRDRPREALSVEGDDPAATPKAMPIGEVAMLRHPRLSTGIGEFDRVLGGAEVDEPPPAPGSGCRSAGGSAARAAAQTQTAAVDRGLVPGSAVLVGGDPGIGKSTLLLQAAERMAAMGQRVLYVTSEESAQQTRLRAERLDAVAESLYVLADTNLARIIEQVRQVEPHVLIIDSIQMIYKGDIEAAPGSVTQLRGCAMDLVYLAKLSGIAVVLVGHVTKQGQLAGPKLLEHMVDTVIYFEGDRYHSHRIVRAIKNRFGATLEVGLFEMGDSGLTEVPDGAALLAAEYRHGGDGDGEGMTGRPGSVICPVLQGTRCLLVEVQALTATGFLGAAKRKTSGLDGSRLAMLIAVLEKHGGLKLADQDVFASSVGGMKVIEPAADLAVALAIAGAHYRRALSSKRGGICAVGEVGLGGEVRHVSRMEHRLKEVTRLGFGTVICPPLRGAATAAVPAGCEILSVNRLDEALALLG